MIKLSAERSIAEYGNQAREVHHLMDLYRSFVTASNEAMLSTNTAGGVLFCNNAFAEQFGFGVPGKALNYSLLRLFRNAFDFEWIAEHAVNGRVSGQKVKLITSAGVPLTGLVNVSSSIGHHGENILNWNILDISRTVEFEENLKTNHAELRKINLAMEKFLYSASHDLRGPVTSILGLVNLIRLEKADSSLVEYIDKIEASTNRLDAIIKNLLGFAKTSYQRTQYTVINIQDEITSILMTFAHEPQYLKINFDVEVKAEGGPFISDRERFRIILENLIRNAIHFFDPAKAWSFVKISCLVSPSSVTVSVFDNGVGIGKIHQTHIFNMFYKASELSKGAGLGLFIVRESLSQLNGSIDVESEPGFGSVFKITIPNNSAA